MQEPQWGRPRSKPADVVPVSELPATPEDPRSLEAQRLAREQARHDAQMQAQASVARGVIYAVMGVLALTGGLDLLQGVFGNRIALIRGLLTFGIVYGIYQGKSWARWALLVISLLTALLVLPSLGLLMAIAPMLGWLAVLIVLMYLGGSVGLFLKPAAYHFENR